MKTANPNSNTLVIYTDGSSLPSPRRGGIGIRILYTGESGEEIVYDENLPGYQGATNNQMELKAACTALKIARERGIPPKYTLIIVFTDSLYITENYRKAMYGWRNNNWLRRSGAPVKNADLWKELTREMTLANRRVEFQWVKGHSKNLHNRAVDKLARESSQNATNPPLNPVSVRRKITKETVNTGAVQMKGQRLTVRIITCEYLRVQKIWQLKYEVMSKASPYRGKVDIIFSEELLKDGHTYYIRVNTNNDNPWIRKVFKEIIT